MNTTAEVVYTLRQPASAFINIGSDDRVATSSNGQPLWTAAQPETNFNIAPGQNISIAQPRRIGVSSVYFPCYLPNLTPFNNVLTMSIVSGTPQTFVIDDPSGSSFLEIYTGTELAALIQQEVRAQSPVDFGSFFCSFVPRTSSFKLFNNGVPFFVSPTPRGSYTSPTTGRTFQNRTDLLRLLAIQSAVNQPSFLLQGGYTTVNQTNVVDICSTRLTQHQGFGDADTNPKATNPLLCRIYVPPLNGQAQTLVFEPQTVKYFRTTPNTFVNNIDIKLIDEDGNEPFFPYQYTKNSAFTRGAAGNEFMITLLISES